MPRRLTALYLPILAFLGLAYVYLPESIDDAYITLRYSRNFMQGHGLVFNPGEHVEGFSNLVWMLLLALAGKLGLSMPAVMKVGGVASGVATIAVAGRAARQWLESELAVVAVRLIIAVSSFFALWSADGLETSFYTLLVTLLVYLAASPRSSLWHLGVVAGLVALTRPEGVLFGLIVLVAVAIMRSVGDAAKLAAPFFAMAIGYELFRALYFHEWVANTAFAKVRFGPEVAAAGLRYFRSFNERSGYLLAPVAILGAMANLRSPGVRLAIAFVLAQVVFLTICGGDFMFGYRFVVPVIPCLALLAAGAVAALTPYARRVAVALLVVVTAGSGYSQFVSLPAKHISTDNLSYRASVLFDIARFVDGITGASDTVLLSEAGIIPFGTRARIVDYLGLVSPFWYVHTPRRSIDVAHVLARDPKLVILSFVVEPSGAVSPRLPEDRDIFESPQFLAQYRPIKRFDIDRATSFLNEIYYFYAPSASVIYFEVFARRAPVGGAGSATAQNAPYELARLAEAEEVRDREIGAAVDAEHDRAGEDRLADRRQPVQRERRQRGAERRRPRAHDDAAAERHAADAAIEAALEQRELEPAGDARRRRQRGRAVLGRPTERATQR